jgi:CRP-like cAMP-binding protein
LVVILGSLNLDSTRNLFLPLNGVHPIDDVVAELLENIVRSKLIRKGDFLAREGQVCRHLYYIEKGIVSHYFNKDGGKAMDWILWENEIVTSVESVFRQIPTKENIVAHEDTLVWYIPYPGWEETFRNSRKGIGLPVTNV